MKPKILIPVLVIVVLIAGPTAYGKTGRYNSWNAYYPLSQSDDNVDAATGKICQLCHETSSGGGTWNAYGYAMKVQIDLGLTDEQALQAIEAANSDGDPAILPLLPGGWSNGLEIEYHGQPGWTVGLNNIYDGDGNVVGTMSAPSGVVNLDPDITVPVQGTTWGRLKRIYRH